MSLFPRSFNSISTLANRCTPNERTVIPDEPREKTLRKIKGQKQRSQRRCTTRPVKIRKIFISVKKDSFA